MQDLPSELGPVLVVSWWKKHGHGRNGINREIEQIEAKIKCLDEASRRSRWAPSWFSSQSSATLLAPTSSRTLTSWNPPFQHEKFGRCDVRSRLPATICLQHGTGCCGLESWRLIAHSTAWQNYLGCESLAGLKDVLWTSETTPGFILKLRSLCWKVLKQSL
jgi:hypothetical protein